VARDRIGELRASGAALVNAISALLETDLPSPGKKQTRGSSKQSKERGRE
jgi:hypothetical protein